MYLKMSCIYSKTLHKYSRIPWFYEKFCVDAAIPTVIFGKMFPIKVTDFTDDFHLKQIQNRYEKSGAKDIISAPREHVKTI